MTPSLSLTALSIAQSELGVHEQGGNNQGPEVNQYLAAVGLGPGYPWCTAFLYWCFRAASERLGMVNPFPKTAGSLRLWTLTEPICRDSNPQVGSVYVLRHTPTTGHVGIVESIKDGVITEISGNTNATGSREGNSVWQHTGQPEVVHGPAELLGYLNFDVAAQPPVVA